MIQKLLFSIFFLVINLQNAFALVVCAPASCSPGCGSSCTYFTCSQSAKHDVEVKQVHIVSDTEPADACAHDVFYSKSLPFSVDGSPHDHLPVTVHHKYLVCQPQTISGPPCPPPPPPKK